MEVSVATGVDAVKRVAPSEELLSDHVIACSDANIESVLLIRYRKAVEQFLHETALFNF